MITCASEFRKAGVSETEMEEQLKEMEKSLSKMKIEESTINAAYEMEMKETLCENLLAAHRSVEAAFADGGVKNGGNTKADLSVSVP